MASLNRRSTTPVRTHEGAPAIPTAPITRLRRLVLASLLWEDTFYVDGQEHAQLVAETVAQCRPSDVASLACEVRDRQHLRHMPLLLCRLLLASEDPLARQLGGGALGHVIQRPDELTEFLALYWKDGRKPIPAAAKRALAFALGKFDEYQLAKYDRKGAVRLRDVLRLVHPKPVSPEQESLWRRLIKDELETPDTWEVALSSGADKLATWERLISENRLGGLALLRNLRNMQQAGVRKETVRTALEGHRFARVLPFRFIAAARAVPSWEDMIEPAMLRAASELDRLPGRTILLVDVSGSMFDRLSAKSDLTRFDAAAGLAILLREVCDEVAILTFSNHVVEVPNRRGFALRDAITQSQAHAGTYLGAAIEYVRAAAPERLIVITDEQSHDVVGGPPEGTRGYMLNVAAYRNGVGFGAWTRVDGWSEQVVRYITELEAEHPAFAVFEALFHPFHVVAADHGTILP